MSNLDDDFDIELDEETLRLIEEEARRKVESEMDDDLIRDIQKEALEEEGIDEFELDADTMREIEEEARRLLAEEGFNLEDSGATAVPEPEVVVDPEPEKPKGPKIAPAVRQASPPEAAHAPPPPPAPVAESPPDEAEEAPVVKSTSAIDSTARRNAVDKARAKAEDRARNKQRKKLKESTSLKARQAAASRRRVISDISAPPDEKGKSKMIIGVVVAFALIIGLAIAVGRLTAQKNQPAPPPATTNSTDEAPAEPGLTKDQQTREQWDAMQKEIRAITRKGQTTENLQKAIDRLNQFKIDHPDYADLCDKDIKRYQGTLNFIQGAGG